MITEFDLNTAIAKCQGEENPDSKTCIMLAAFYIIKNEMFGSKEQAEMPLYSYDAVPDNQGVETITYQSETEFSQLIEGRHPNDVFAVMDELMSTLQMLNPKLYNSVIRNIKEG